MNYPRWINFPFPCRFFQLASQSCKADVDVLETCDNCRKPRRINLSAFNARQSQKNFASRRLSRSFISFDFVRWVLQMICLWQDDSLWMEKHWQENNDWNFQMIGRFIQWVSEASARVRISYSWNVNCIFVVDVNDKTIKARLRACLASVVCSKSCWWWCSMCVLASTPLVLYLFNEHRGPARTREKSGSKWEVEWVIRLPHSGRMLQCHYLLSHLPLFLLLLLPLMIISWLR